MSSTKCGTPTILSDCPHFWNYLESDRSDISCWRLRDLQEMSEVANFAESCRMWHLEQILDLQEMSGYLKTSDFSKSGENLPKSWNCWLGANSCSFQETGGLGTKPRDPGFGRSGTETRGFRRGGLGGPETGLEGVLGAPEQVGTGTWEGHPNLLRLGFGGLVLRSCLEVPRSLETGVWARKRRSSTKTALRHENGRSWRKWPILTETGSRHENGRSEWKTALFQENGQSWRKRPILTKTGSRRENGRAAAARRETGACGKRAILKPEGHSSRILPSKRRLCRPGFQEGHFKSRGAQPPCNIRQKGGCAGRDSKFRIPKFGGAQPLFYALSLRNPVF